MENILFLSLFIMIFIFAFIILYLLKYNIQIKKDIQIIKDELEITSAIFEVKFDNYGTKYKRKATNLHSIKDLDEKKQLSLDLFMNSPS